MPKEIIVLMMRSAVTMASAVMDKTGTVAAMNPGIFTIGTAAD